nr:type II toxin-antitoxin system HicA family toxin [Chelativorans xinjiangense]
MNNYTKSLKAILSRAGWVFHRPGRGDHEIWRHPVTGRRVVVDNAIKSRHTANGVLKQAGLPKAF